MNRWHLFLAAVLTAAACAAQRGSAADSPDMDVATLLKRSKPAVAELLGWENGQDHIGTGFLLDDRTIITNAHVVAGIKTLSARFPGQPGFIPCALIATDPDVDLAAVRLKNAVPGRALKLVTDKADPEGEKILIIGSARGLDNSWFEGRVNARVRTRAEVYEKLGWMGILPPKQASLKAIQHNAPSTFGMSGGPVINRKGLVLGVEREGLAGESNVNFCIPAYYINDLNLMADPKDFPDKVPETDFNKVLDKHSEIRPSAGPRIDEDLSCYHWGFIPKGRAEDVRIWGPDVFKRYIGDKEGFKAFVPAPTLEAVLARNNIVHVTHPAFRFALLVPNNQTLVQETRTNPVGITITITSDDPRIPVPLNSLRLTAWRIHRPIQSYQKKQPAPAPKAPALAEIGRLGMVVRNGGSDHKPTKIEPPRSGDDNPIERSSQAGAEVEWIHSVMRDIAWRYPAETRQLRLFLSNPTVPSRPRREDALVMHQYSDREVRIVSNLRAARFRGVYASPRQFDTGWAYHFAIHDDVVIVIDYEFQYSALENAPTMGYPKDLAERMFMASSLTFY